MDGTMAEYHWIPTLAVGNGTPFFQAMTRCETDVLEISHNIGNKAYKASEDFWLTTFSKLEIINEAATSITWGILRYINTILSYQLYGM